MAMYGSIHTHFESQYDTANDLSEMLRRFLSSGAEKVAVTEHGVFSSFEDLSDLVGKLHKKAKNIVKKMEENGITLPEVHTNGSIDELLFSINPFNDKVSDQEYMCMTDLQMVARYVRRAESFQVIPGVEGYFGENNAHMILLAKDYEGYLSLCKIISESNQLMAEGSKRPVITMENLKRNVRKGHVVCTSACVAGPFGHLFGLDTVKLDEKIEKLTTELTQNHIFEYQAVITEYEDCKAQAKEAHVIQKERTAAKKYFKLTEDDSKLKTLEQRDAREADLLAHMEEIKPRYDAAVMAVKALGKGAITTKLNNLRTALEEKSKADPRQNEEIAKGLLNELCEIFSPEDFYFEIQNHGLYAEEVIYNNVINFAIENGHPHFVASNDIHVGVRKSDADYEDALTRRNVIKYTRFNTYQEESEDDREYVIKSDEELKEELLKMVHPIPGMNVETEVVDAAIENIRGVLSQCQEIKFPKTKHYPKFCDDEAAEFERKVREGIKLRFPNGFPDEEKYNNRLEYELDVIKRMGYSGYHLIVADYLEYGRLLGYLKSQEEIDNSPLTIEGLRAYIREHGYEEVGYSIGPGRGSAVGSLCCYALGITDIDPIPYNLLFERFLNVERVSMPDVDSDFMTNIRARVVDYCRAKYGSECICQIMTKTYNSAKGNYRLAARYLGAIQIKEKLGSGVPIPGDEEDIKGAESEDAQNSTLIKKMTKKELNEKARVIMAPYYNAADELSKQYDAEGGAPDESTLTGVTLDIARLSKKLDGVFTAYGQHAAGTIISGDDLTEILPLMWNAEKGGMETQCTMAQAESKGLLKMDFLGLNNLDIITKIIQDMSVGCFKEFVKNAPAYVDMEMVNRTWLDTTLQDYERRDKMLQDSNIFEKIFQSGLTQGVFQFESPGMKKMLMEFKPETFEDIILLVAAYRPGPLQYLPEIIQTKQYNDQQAGKAFASIAKIGKIQKPVPSINIDNDALKSILSPTYGSIIYQEQVMQIFQDLAGYSLGGADLVRRAMSKKHLEELVPERAAFIHGDPARNIEGCVKKQGISEQDANLLFDQMMEFAKYAFNKSHATAYAMVAMFTAYLKTYHTVDFYRESLNAVSKLTEIPPFMQEMSEFGITLKAPSLINSKDEFSSEDDGKSVLYGLHYIKGFSSQEGVVRASTVQEFMERNPDITVKSLKKYAQLGLFTGAWAKDLQKRPWCHRHEILKMIDRDGDVLKKYYEIVGQMADVAEQEKEAEKSVLEGTAPADTLARLSKKLEDLTKTRTELAGILNMHCKEDWTAKPVLESNSEVLENRQWETESLSIPFSIESSLKKVRECDNKKTFKELKMSISANGGFDSLLIPVVILSVSEPKMTKNSGKTYYDVTMMDREGSYLVRRFDTVPERLEGEYYLPLEECKYYTAKASRGKTIVSKHAYYKELNASTMTAQQKAEALKASFEIKRVPIQGNLGFSRCVMQNKDLETEEMDERDC